MNIFLESDQVSRIVSRKGVNILRKPNLKNTCITASAKYTLVDTIDFDVQKQHDKVYIKLMIFSLESVGKNMDVGN